jgi:hypothetical protein
MTSYSEEYEQLTNQIDQLCTANQHLVDSVIRLREKLAATWSAILPKDQVQNSIQSELRDIRIQYSVVEKTFTKNTLAFLLLPILIFFVWSFWWGVIHNPVYPLATGIFCLLMIGALLRYIFDLKLDSLKYVFKARPEKVNDVLSRIIELEKIIQKQQKIYRANREDAVHNLNNQNIYLQALNKKLADCLTKILSF